MKSKSLMFVACILLLAACAPIAPASPSQPGGPAGQETRDLTIAPETPIVEEESKQVLNTDNPLALAAAKDLARRLGVGLDQITVLSVESVVWPDGGLGCPRPGMMYTQVQVDGARILLQSAGKVYEYHSGGDEPPFLCEQP